jgi:hypothetical protein
MAYAPAAAAASVPAAVALRAAPLPRVRPPQPRQMPAWLVSMLSLSTAAAAQPLTAGPVRSFAAAEAAIAAAMSSPAAFAAPAIIQAADAMPMRTAQARGVPLPRPRPQGIVPVPQ